MSKENKGAREFYIRQGSYSGDTSGNNPFYSVVSDTPEEIKDPIHVIEYSAVVALEKQLAVAVEALSEIYESGSASDSEYAKLKLSQIKRSGPVPGTI